MTKTKKSVFVGLIAFLSLIIAFTLFGCDKGDSTPAYTSTGQGSVIESVDETTGVKTFTAVADEWNVFTGWYNGLVLYSSDAEITVDKTTPKGLVAKFASSGTISIDRILNGAYNTYSDAVETRANYLNLAFDTDISVAGSLVTATVKNDSGLCISLDGTGFQVYSTFYEGEEPISSWYYVDDTNESKLYLDANGEKVTVKDFETIGSRLISVPDAALNIWTLENVIGSELFSELETYIGIRNSVGFIDSVENYENQTRLNLNVDEFLNALKDVVPSSSDPKYDDIKEIVESLTSQYQGLAKKLPEISLEIVIDYETKEDKEYIKTFTAKATFEEEYKIELGENVITIPACTATCSISNVDLTLSSTPNSIPSEILSTFPEAVHAGNIHAEGTLTFAKENVARGELNVIDQYLIELDSDIDINFMKEAIDDDGNVDVEKIDWEKFGFLNFRISLIEDASDTEQASRHNGSTEYLNILIDTAKYGAKALVYIDLYNPKTLNGMGTTTYIINASYDIAELARVMPEIIENLSGETATPETAAASVTSDENLVANIISDIINEILNITGEKTADEILFDIVYAVLNDVAPENSLVQDGLSYSEYGTTIAVEEIKETIDQEFSNANSTLGSLQLHNNIFGEDTTHIAVLTNSFSYGSVRKNENDQYAHKNGKTFAEIYNAHKTLVDATEGQTVSGLTDKSFTLAGLESELASLVGTNVTVEGIFSDGSVASTYTNCQGNQVALELKIYSTNYEMIDESTAEISVYLTFCTGTLQSLMVNTFDVPYGLVEFSFQTQVA